MSKTPHTPFYLQITNLLQKAIALLDEQGREEVLQFILGNQHADGGFKDRGGKSDLYYSLFGLLLLKALKDREKGEIGIDMQPVAASINQLKQFTQAQVTLPVRGFIERCCLVLLQKELKSGKLSRLKSFGSLSRSFWKERASINLSYRSFVLFLTLDAVLPFSAIINRPAQKMVSQNIVNEHSPCSEIAAKVFINSMTGKRNISETDLLCSFACPSGGFKAFTHLNHADLLSTAVALFALQYSGADLRLLKPSMLDFIQSNYSEGAFLSGDGDLTADVEYTFYGLLALGVLSK